MSALRSGQYKIARLTEEAPWQLYDLKKNLGETTDIAEKQPDILARLSREFEEWDKQVRRW